MSIQVQVGTDKKLRNVKIQIGYLKFVFIIPFFKTVLCLVLKYQTVVSQLETTS